VNIVVVIVLLIAAVVHIAFAVAVYSDANMIALRVARDNPAHKTGTVFVGPLIWLLATLVGGIFTALAYWLMHHSTLRPTEETETG